MAKDAFGIDLAALSAFAEAQAKADAASAAIPNMPVLVALLVGAAKAASNAITSQIATTETHLAGYQSAANIVTRSGGAVPTANPDKTAFAAIAAATGISEASLATLVVAMDAASVTNLAILITIETAAAAATTPAQLATALTTYEASLGTLVTSLNGAGLTTTITAPAAITIPGINA